MIITASLDQAALADLVKGLSASAETVAKATRRAVGFAASFLRGQMKGYIASGGAGSWAALSPVTPQIKRNPPTPKKRKASKAGNAAFLGKLKNVIRYDLTPEGTEPVATVGIIASTVGEKGFSYFQAFQKGGEILSQYRPPMTDPSESRYFAALGFRRRKDTVPNQPSRPVVGPVWEKEKQNVQLLMLTKFRERLENPK